jgi:hypothetical protein
MTPTMKNKGIAFGVEVSFSHLNQDPVFQEIVFMLLSHIKALSLLKVISLNTNYLFIERNQRE